MKIAIAAVAIILLIWAGIYIYFRANKAELLQKVTTTASTKLRGEVKIGDIGLNFIADFPRIMLRLENVTVRDSLYSVHKHDLLKANKLFVSTRLFEMMSGKLQPSKITVENGQIYLFTDSNGYSNRYITSREEGQTKRPVSNAFPDKIVLKNVGITLANEQKKKFHNFYVRKLNCKISGSGPALVFKTKVDATIRSMIFNADKGSYAKDKSVSGDFNLRFDTVQKQLQAKNISLRIGEQPFRVNATFNFDSLKNFTLQIESNKVAFNSIKEIITPAIRKKIDSIDITKPISVKADIAGRTVFRDTPYVRLYWTVNNNTLVTPKGNFDSASFKGSFTNRVSDTASRNDENSAINITGFKASWEGIPVASDTLNITNLKYPVITCDIQSNTDLSILDEVIGSESFEFKRGEARTKIYYHGPLGDSAKVSPYISGSFSFNNAEMEYLPRGIHFTNFNGDIIFDSSDIRFKQLKGKVQDHSITINAEIKNFFALLDIDPGKLELTSSIYMPELDVQQFRSFLKQRSAGSRKTKGRGRLVKLARSIDKVMDQCNMNTSLQADKVSYKKFVATAVKANVYLTNNAWRFSNVSLNHADGTLNLDGSLEAMQESSHHLNMNASLQSINISKLFESFNNFGMEDLDAKNIRGVLTTNIRLSGTLNNEAVLLPSSLNGTIDLSLMKGQLIDFEPLQKMSFFLLKKRDFSNLEFAELKNRFELNGRFLVINRMEVQSTALSMYVEGLYDLRGDSTDLVIQVPLNNLKKRKPDYVPENKGVDAKTGMSVYVRARSGKGDDIDFKVGLFKKKSALEKNHP